MFTTIIKTTFKTILLALIVAIITPTVWLAWRANQPMDMPEFKGLTYFQYMEWRKMSHQNLIAKYNASHPNYKYTGWGDQMTACWGADAIVGTLVPGEMSLYGAFAAYKLSAEDLTKFKAAQHDYAPDKIYSLLDLPKAFWYSYEWLQWSAALYAPEGPVAFCRVQPKIPTPAEFETMKQVNQQASVVK